MYASLKQSTHTVENAEGEVESKGCIPSETAGHSGQLNLRPPSVNCMNEHMYALQRTQRTGPTADTPFSNGPPDWLTGGGFFMEEKFR